MGRNFCIRSPPFHVSIVASSCQYAKARHSSDDPSINTQRTHCFNGVTLGTLSIIAAIFFPSGDAEGVEREGSVEGWLGVGVAVYSLSLISVFTQFPPKNTSVR